MNETIKNGNSLKACLGPKMSLLITAESFSISMIESFRSHID